MRHSGKLLATAALMVLPLMLPLPAFAADLWLVNAHLIDGRGGEEVPLVDVHVVDGRIATVTAVASRKSLASQGASGAATTIDLKGAYLLPGYVDAHAHIGDPASAKRALLSGVTTARVLGDVYLKGLATRDLIRQHDVSGPEILASAGHIRPVLASRSSSAFPSSAGITPSPCRAWITCVKWRALSWRAAPTC
jgi:hypothetical protein